jgi:flavin reductase (DIM6/NTAB) family NADH-FMN oxidoreductase RutF
MKKSLGKQTLLYPTPVLAVGSYDQDGNPNVAIAAWGGICCSQPPCVTISWRETRYSYQNILQRKAFTVSIPSEKYVKEADYFGIVSGKGVNKFETAGLTAVKSKVVDAPYVGEFPIVLECALLQTLKLGSHIQLIGEIKDVKAEENVLDQSGMPDMEKCKPLVFVPGAMTYNVIGKAIAEAFQVGKEIK